MTFEVSAKSKLLRLSEKMGQIENCLNIPDVEHEGKNGFVCVQNGYLNSSKFHLTEKMPFLCLFESSMYAERVRKTVGCS